jgi:putative ABC transport system permease protein
MIRNHFLVAWRNLLKSKGFTSLNIIGLAVGM